MDVIRREGKYISLLKDSSVSQKLRLNISDDDDVLDRNIMAQRLRKLLPIPETRWQPKTGART